MVAHQLDPSLLRKRARGLRRVEHEQRSGPPADFVIREIPDSVWRLPVGSDELAGEVVHPPLSCRIEGVEPVEPGEPPEFEVDYGRKFEGRRRQRPAAGAVKAPCEEAPARLGGPIGQGRSECLPAVPGLARLLAFGVTAVEDIDAETEKAISARRYQPPDAVFTCQPPAGRRRCREVNARPGSADRKRGCDYCCDEDYAKQRGRDPRHALVPPTVRPSIRNVGWPTPTGTPCPSLPQVPIPSSRRRSLPIIVTLVSASGPLPMRVAPLTAGPTLPSS